MTETLDAQAIEFADKISKKRGPKPGTMPINARFGCKTKVVRIPECWDLDTIIDRFEEIHSALYTAEAELDAARDRGNGSLSNRFQHLAAFVAELREVMPRNDRYDPIKGD